MRLLVVGNADSPPYSTDFKPSSNLATSQALRRLIAAQEHVTYADFTDTG